jgi:DNA ligase-1
VIKDSINYPLIVEPKLDGLRCIAIKKNNVVTLYTRNGRSITTLPTIVKVLEDCEYDNLVFDGEVMGRDWNESASIVGSKKTMKDDSNIVFNVFDCLTLGDWLANTSNIQFTERLRMACSVLKGTSSCIRLVEGVLVSSEAELLAFYEHCLEKGHEGIMLKDPRAPYAFKRTDAMLKMKPTATYEGTIVGWYPGRDGTKNAEGFGGFYVVLSNGVITRVGGGFSDEDRTTIQFEGYHAYIGIVVEIEGQPPLTKDGRIRFPVFIRYRDPSDVDPLVVEAYVRWMTSATDDKVQINK